MKKETKIYKINFLNAGKIYQLYAKQVYQSNLFGFIEVEELLFGEKSSVVVDPSEEKLKTEFSGVKCSHIPVHAILRIDEVNKRGIAKIEEVGEKGAKISPFPGPYYSPNK